MLQSGVSGKPVVFLFTDTQIVSESFLEDVNNVLNTGEVPNLWETDEVNKIIEDLRPVCVQQVRCGCAGVGFLLLPCVHSQFCCVLAQGFPDTRDNVYRLFVSRVRDNLHIVLAMSPVGDSFRVRYVLVCAWMWCTFTRTLQVPSVRLQRYRCRQFPSLINCTTIDWFMPWPDEALLSVANRFLGEEDIGTDDVRNAVAAMCVHIHQSIAQHSVRFYEELQRQVYTTPKSYLDLINLYLSVLSEKREELARLRKRLAVGVGKLEEANHQVASLQVELTKLQPVLDAKTKETDALLIQVAEDQKEADSIKSKVQIEEVRVVIDMVFQHVVVLRIMVFARGCPFRPRSETRPTRWRLCKLTRRLTSTLRCLR